MVKFIGEGLDGAIDRFCNAVAEGKREEGFIAGGKGDELEFAETVGNLGACQLVNLPLLLAF